MFRTNFDKKRLPKYKQAIIRFKIQTGSDRLYIIDHAYDVYGNLVIDSYALHDKEWGDLSLFWRIFDNISENKNIQINYKLN